MNALAMKLRRQEQPCLQHALYNVSIQVTDASDCFRRARSTSTYYLESASEFSLKGSRTDGDFVERQKSFLLPP